MILDCAEELFAEKGFNGVTLNEVAIKAGVDTALMRYYFGNKQQLFESVFKRRGPAINELRRAAMSRARAEAGDNLTLEDVIDGFTRAPLEIMQVDPGWRNYMAIVAYVNSSRGYLNHLMSDTFDHVSHELLEDMRALLPGIREDDLYWCYHFLTGAFTFSLGQTGRIDKISDGRVLSADGHAIAERLPTFVAAGMRALNISRSNQASAPKKRGRVQS